MRKIFILKAKSETGKTTKINQIAEWIINNYKCPNSIGLNTSNFLQDTHGILTINKLTIGINSAGDNESEVKKIDKLILENNERPDIILCTCRTKGKGWKHIIKNYNRATGWLSVFINVEEFPKIDIKSQSVRDARVIDELKTWLIGLEKL